LRKGIRKLLKAAGFHVSGQRRGLSPEAQALVERYVDRDRKADIDWADPQQRAAQLKVLVEDAESALGLVMDQADEFEVRATGWLLTKILGDDLVSDEDGNPQIGKGTAPDRIISVTEPEMRHGRKSSAHRFDGFKVIVSTEQSSELILDIADMTAMGSDGAQLIPTIERVEAETGVVAERVIGDGAFGSGENRAACANYEAHPIDLVSPLRQPRDPAVAKSAFQIDLQAQTATCPQGHTVTSRSGARKKGETTLGFAFPRATCEACPLFERCVHSQTAGRTVRTHVYEEYLQAATDRQSTEEFKRLYRLRPPVERKIAELVRHGLRNTRYLGQRKRQLQRLWTAAAVNLKRLIRIAQAQGTDLQAVFSRLGPQPGLLASP
jgi:hypothetical protein